MAKDKRFPSNANKSPVAKAAPKAPEAKEIVVQGQAQDLVQVMYTKDNHHILGAGVHAVRKGINHLPKSVWEESKKHPTIQKMLADKHLIDMSAASAPAEEELEESKDEEEEPKDGEQSGDGEKSEDEAESE